jgi:hypothetical protein
MRPDRCLKTLVVGCTFVAGGSALAQKPEYAPRAEIPAEASNNAMLQMEIRSVRAAQVPKLEEVEAPPYPGAVILRTIAARTSIKGGDEFVDELPIIVLLTPDEPFRVVNYYERNLPGWSRKQFLSSPYFWMGEGEFHPLERSGWLTPSIEVRQAPLSRLVPNAKTEIRVRYQPDAYRIVGE